MCFFKNKKPLDPYAPNSDASIVNYALKLPQITADIGQHDDYYFNFSISIFVFSKQSQSNQRCCANVVWVNNFQQIDLTVYNSQRYWFFEISTSTMMTDVWRVYSNIVLQIILLLFFEIR